MGMEGIPTNNNNEEEKLKSAAEIAMEKIGQEKIKDESEEKLKSAKEISIDKANEYENDTIKRESGKEKPEEIFGELIKNRKIEAIFQKEKKIQGAVERMRAYAPGQDGYDEYKKDLKIDLQIFLHRFPKKEDFEKYVEEKRKKNETEKEKVKAEYERNPSSEYYKSIIKSWKLQEAYEKEHGWEASFGEAYEESLKEFSQLLYEGAEKYQKEKTKKTEQCIEDAKSFEDLNNAIKASGGIQGSQDFFDSKTLKNIIDKVRKGEKKINDITRTGGLRQKVEDLLALEKVRGKMGLK